MKDLTERFMVMKEYICEKYPLTPEEYEALNHLGYDLCKFELGEDVAEAYFNEPVSMGEDGVMKPIKEREVN